MHLSPLAFAWYYLWIAPHLLLLLVAGLMWRRAWHHQFPWFFSYLLYEAAGFVLTFTLSQFTRISVESYRLVDGVLLVGSMALRAAVVYEIFKSVSRSYPVLLRAGRLLIGWGLVALLSLCVVLAVLERAGNADRLLRLGTGLSRSMSLMQCGLLVFLLLFSSYLKLSWRNFAWGVAVGLGVFAAVDMAGAALLSDMAPVSRQVKYIFDFVTMGTYHCCVLIWLGYLLAPACVPQGPGAIPPHDLESWDRELQRVLQQ